MPENKRMIYKLPIFLLLFAIFISLRVQSQESKGYRYYDSLTYHLYSAGNWKSLKVAGAEALGSDLDYYYLRVRMGIALYKMQNYRASASHFEKALKFNAHDPFALQYLYAAYLESGRNIEAAKLAASYKDIITTVPGATGRFVNSVYAEMGITPNSLPGQNAASLMGKESLYGESDLISEQKYYHAGISLQLSPAISMYTGAAVLDINKQRRFAYASLNAQGINTFSDTAIDYQFRQTELYVSASAALGYGITLTNAFHLMKGNPPIINSMKENGIYTFREYLNPYNHYVLSLSATKAMGNFSLGINGSYARLGSMGNQKQFGTSITWYPFGNLKLYNTGSLTGLLLGNTKRFIVDEAIGGRILPKIWLEGTFTKGDMSYYNEKNAFVVYNQSETIIYRIGANLIYTLSPHLDLSLMYRFYGRENEYANKKFSMGTGGDILITNNFKYNNYSFFGGLKWKL